jgi:hypothetical protein
MLAIEVLRDGDAVSAYPPGLGAIEPVDREQRVIDRQQEASRCQAMSATA